MYGSPRDAILRVSHDKDLQECIYKKVSWIPETFDKVDWKGFENYMGTIPSAIQTNVIKNDSNLDQ